MPRIDPLQLLKCLSVLLAPDGGIKSREEVSRLVSLMTKFSKKLVSKCIYIQILRATKSDLLDMFMAAGGWNLTHQWLLDAIMAKNHPLNCEILQLLALCPVNVERLRSNSCPKLVKGLSIESSDENEKLLANNLVIQWMEVVRNEVEVGKETVTGHDTAAVVDVPVPNKSEAVNTVSVDVVVETSVDSRTSETNANSVAEVVSVKSLEKKTVDSEEIPNIPVVDGEERTEEGGGTSEDSNSPWDAPLPLYKIMIRDGKQVLAKVYSEKRPTPEIPSNEIPSIDHNVSGAVIVKVPPSEENVVSVDQTNDTTVIVTPCPVSLNTNESTIKIEVATASESLETNELESEKKTKVSSSDTSSVKTSDANSKGLKESKKKIREAKLAVSAPSEKKTRLPESGPSKEKHKEKDRDRGKTKEKVKEEKKKDAKSILQAEKDKETLAKIMIVSSAVSKTVGKIPKKKVISEDNNAEAKKVSPAAHEVRRAQKPSISIERRSQGTLGEPRPKTVKTFNSKFRSTGLEEEVKPPPPRNAAKKNTSEKNARMPIPSRRPSPPREIFPPEKKPRAGAGILTEVAPTVPAYSADEMPRKGDKNNTKMNALKAKDKPSVAFLQESDVFMDALTAVSRKEPRRRKRRTSSSKDDDKNKGKESENKKEEPGETQGGTPPHSPDEKTPPMKLSFKFYQDTLETDDEAKKVKEENLSDEERRATTPTPKDEDSPSAENEASDEDSRTRSSKKKIEQDMSLARKRIKKEEDENDSSAESDDNWRKREALSKGLRGILIYHKRTSIKNKKIVKWKEDGELEKVVYFELDETERVNVTKTFMDMKQMERTHEREAFQMARKLAHEDIMEERIQWQSLVPLTLPPPLAEPGSKSREKDVQYAREKVVLQSLYFHRDMIPDSPSEPDNEIHPTTDPAIIPLNDASGNPDSINDFQSTPWPEPKSLQPPISAGPPAVGPSGPSVPVPMMPGMTEHNDPNYMAQHPHPHMVQGHPMIGGGMSGPFGGGMHPNQIGTHPIHGGFTAPTMGGPAMGGAQISGVDNSMHQRASHVMMSGPRPMMHPQNSQQLPMAGMMNPGIQGVAGAGGDWRTADGKVVPVEDSQPMVMYAQSGVSEVGMAGNNVPQIEGEMNTTGYEMDYGVQYQEGMEESSVGGPGYMMPPMNYAGGATNTVRPPHGGTMYGHPPIFRGSGSRGGRGGPTPRGGPWFRPSGPPHGRGGNWEMGRGRGGRGNIRVTPCKHFRAGYCRNGKQCNFLHPGVNGPPVPYMYSE
ncbi:serine/threonine-protein phosphatase 1 regulatory subunit 10-like [Hetaerina americana]|uniref:serine/threonine-protein phosphatase 1 regulatory subunit 10-like n=1 Tax=Hetaerina americana TaxID=62018 RepID=UPI003A7F34E2